MTVPPAAPASSPPSAGRAPLSVGRARRVGRGLRLLYRTLRINPLSFAGFVLVVLLGATGLVVWLVPSVLPYPALSINLNATNLAPSWAHPFGTDELGRDLLSNVLAGLPVDLAIGFTIAGGSLLFGGALGVVAGYYNRPRSLGAVASMVILRVTDLFLAFPALILALAFTIALGRGLYPIVLAVFLTWWPFYVRLARGEVLVVKNQPYIAAARAAGVSEGRIVLRHVLRNILEPLMVYFTLDVGTVIVTFSTVAFVTHGIQYPVTPPVEWGAMVAYYEDYVTYLPWTVLFPGIAIFVTVLAFSLLGDGLRDVLDPRTRQSMIQVGSAAREGRVAGAFVAGPDEEPPGPPGPEASS